MRLGKDAPVDSMGCERVTNMKASENIKRFQILVGLMLSSQTKDGEFITAECFQYLYINIGISHWLSSFKLAVTYAACQKLHNFGFTPENLVKADQTELENLLIPVGFYRNKAKFIKNTSQILIDQYNSDIPDTVEGLMKLPGVGPKMAHIWWVELNMLFSII